ncbi:MAG: hypothetical protein AAF957_15080 [Planctomycetota bacterium]
MVEIEVELEFSDTQTLRYAVHTSPVEYGTYSEVFARSIQVTGTGLGTYSSGPMNLEHSAGQHDIISVSWTGTTDLTFGFGGPVSVSFGEHTHGYATGAHPFPPSFSSTVNDFAVYSQRLSTGGSGGLGGNDCLPGTPNSTGVPGHLAATGTDMVASNGITLVTADLRTNATVLFLTSRNQGFVLNPGGSAGTLCVVGAIGRFVGPGQIGNAGATGSYDLRIDLTMLPKPTGFAAAAQFETWNIQAWHRDVAAGGGVTSKFTPRLAIFLR